MIASHVRCTCIRENAEYIASKLDVNIALWHTMPVPMNAMYFMPPTSRHERADAVAQRQHVEQRIGDVAEHAGDRQLLPDEQVAPPHGDEAQREFRRDEQRGGAHAIETPGGLLDRSARYCTTAPCDPAPCADLTRNGAAAYASPSSGGRSDAGRTCGDRCMSRLRACATHRRRRAGAVPRSGDCAVELSQPADQARRAVSAGRAHRPSRARHRRAAGRGAEAAGGRREQAGRGHAGRRRVRRQGARRTATRC